MKNPVYTFLLLLLNISATFPQTRVITGAERFINEYIDSVKNLNIGIVTNHSAILQDGNHLVDALLKIDKIKIKALFGPEHGLKGNSPDGKKISNDFYEDTSIPIYSLYGERNKPTPEMLSGLDLMVFDIQDIGARFYTYISTLFYTIEACTENKIRLIILDRPNPIGGLYVDGPVLESELKSFVGIIPIPITHGMTVGELASMMNEKHFESKCRLKVITMKNWRRNFYFDNCNLPWINPSPNIVNIDAAIIYPGLCLIEGTNISEGRGTYSPFLQIGAPFINSKELQEEILKYKIQGIIIDTVSFIPKSIAGMADKPKFLGLKCYGIKFQLNDREKFQSVRFGVALIDAIEKLYPDKFEFRKGINRLYGKNNFAEEIFSEKPVDSIFKSWQKELAEFKDLRNNYLIY